LSIDHTQCVLRLFIHTMPLPLRSTLFPYTTLFRSSELPEPLPAFPGARFEQFRQVLGAERIRNITAVSLQTREHNFGVIANTFRSEEHTSELQSRENLVCRLLLEKKKKTNKSPNTT